jgi:hypothetical protein
MSSQGIFDEYTTVQWIAAIIVAIISFPIGLAVPIYFYIKTSNGSASEQGPWEAWGVILGGIIGILLVEILGELGGKISVALAILIPILVILAAVVGTFVIGVGSTSGLLVAPAVVL